MSDPTDEAYDAWRSPVGPIEFDRSRVTGTSRPYDPTERAIPAGVVSLPYKPGGWTEAQVEEFKREWQRKWSDPAKLTRHMNREVMRQLKRRTRVRLAIGRARDRAAGWLIEHERYRLAGLLWPGVRRYL